jgi:hypothetical protein
MTDKVVVPKLIGGLGNQLFILAAAMDIAIRSNRILVFHDTPGNPHSDEKRRLKDMFPDISVKKDIKINKEYSGLDMSYKDILEDIDSNYETIFISGYNQHPKYIPDGFCNFINNIPEQPPYTKMDNTAFLHVRRGDYVNHTIYEINSDIYYKTCVKDLLMKCPSIKLLIVSDDTTWSNKYITELLKDIIPSENIVYLNREYTATETLKIMANCLGGAICANSSFSWWGAFVNKDRPIYMPHPWCAYDISPTLGLYFDGVLRVSWETGEIL